jgi:hypothetical protein
MAQVCIAAQVLGSRRMQRYPAGFVKLGLADQQARGLRVKLDIRDQEVAGFTRTQPGTRQQAEPRLVGQGS